MKRQDVLETQKEQKEGREETVDDLLVEIIFLLNNSYRTNNFWGNF